MQDAGHVVAAVDGYKLSAQGVAVAMFEKRLLHIVRRFGTEVHRHVFAVERKAAERNAQHPLVLCRTDGRRISDDVAWVVPSLFGIIELDAPDLCGRLDGEERLFAVFDDEERPRRARAVGQGSAPASGTVCTQQRDIATKDESSLHRITALGRFHIEHTAQWTHLVDGCLQIATVLFCRVTWQHPYSLYRQESLSI